MGLCRNRPEGFGPKSTISSPLPTTCFTDTILLPLPICLLPILIFASFLLTKRTRNPPTSHVRVRQARTCAYTSSLVIYYFIIAANIMMQTIEIVRLSLLGFGLGLLPLTYVGLLAGGILHATHGLGHRISMWQAINLFLWTGGFVFSIIKTVGLVYEGVDKRKGTKYPMSDHITDTGVMAGLYAVLVVFELVRWRLEGKRICAERESLGSATPVPERGSFGLGDEPVPYGEEMK